MTGTAERKDLDGRVVGRYALYDRIAAGGMAAVHVGRLAGVAGFTRTVAIKRLHPHLVGVQGFVPMLIDEARLVARVRHPNVVQILDVVDDEGELLLVMEYVHGEAVSGLMRALVGRGQRMPVRIAAGIVAQALHGLHAAHEATDELGKPLGIVHRDVSPQNVMLGTDGVARVLDFGVAKAAGRLQQTEEGELKGKVAYMSPEQLRAADVDRRSDVWSASVLFWEMLAGERLFDADAIGAVVARVMVKGVDPPSARNPSLPRWVDDVVLRGLAFEASSRFQTALEMALAIEASGDVATVHELSEWMKANVTDRGRRLEERIAEIESASLKGGAVLKADDAGEEPVPESAGGAAVTRVVPRRETVGTSRSPRRRVVIALVAVAALAALVALVALLMRPRSTVAGKATTPTASASTPAAAAPAAPPSAPATATEPAAASAPSNVPARPAERAPARAVRPAPATPVPSRPTTRPPAVSCDPPYTVDSSGFRVPKRECL